MKRGVISLALFLTISLIPSVAPINSSAVENGVLLDGDENAVYLLDGSVNAFLYKPQIAFTSANPVTQLRWGLRYIEVRYDTPCQAWSKFRRSNWY